MACCPASATRPPDKIPIDKITRIMAHERHQRRQPDAAVDQAGTEGVPQLVWGDAQRLSVTAAQPGGGDRVEQALAQPE